MKLSKSFYQKLIYILYTHIYIHMYISLVVVTHILCNNIQKETRDLTESKAGNNWERLEEGKLRGK